MIKAKIKGFLIFIVTISLLVMFSGCGALKEKEKQKENTWEQDMNRLIEKATPKEKENK